MQRTVGEPSDEPVFFGIVRSHGRDSPRRFHELVPRGYADRSRRGELRYCVRIDTLADGDALIAAPLDRLMQQFATARRVVPRRPP